jgi:hypothetical protein
VINEDNIVPDWVFEGGMNSRFATDPNYELPGVMHGVCLENRDTGCTRGVTPSQCTGAGVPFPCCTAAGQGPTCGSECAAFGDTCDFREPGFRIQVQAVQIRDANGDPVQTACGTALAVLRGTPEAGCTLQPRYPVDGDPGADCGVFNYGVDARTDADCNGVAEFPADKCPFLSEWDNSADSDLDCAGGVDADCRGDECECGDSNLNGGVAVTDLTQTNLMIFGALPQQRIADANSDLRVTVSDIVGQNGEIFVPDSAVCRHITSIRCGNNVRNEGEPCDNGARCAGGQTPGAACDASGQNTCGNGTCERVGGDGCNPACRVENGWSCVGNVGQPSVCTRI